MTQEQIKSQYKVTPENDQKIMDLGASLYKSIEGAAPGVFNKDYWQGRIMEWAMKDPSFKVDMFRFVDVLPVLEKSDQVAQHVKEYLLQEGRELPAVLNIALKAASGGITSGLAAMTIKKNVNQMAKSFIIGTEAKSAISTLKKLHKSGIAFTADLLGEATVSEAESVEYQQRYFDLIDSLADEVTKWKADEVIDTNHLGLIPRNNVSIKISAMYSQIDPTDLEGSVKKLKERILPLFLRAKEKNVFVNMDLEQWAYHDITYALFEEIALEPELLNWPHIAIVVQAYLTESENDVKRLIALAKKRQCPISVRLVKGAYWDYETVIAKQNHHEIPVYQQKAATDENFERLTRLLLENVEHIFTAFASHNLRSLSHAMVIADELNVPKAAYEIQQLYGMAEAERKIFRKNGQRVRVYAPVGELLPGMAYLVRRLLENTSNEGFLKQSHEDKVDFTQLLKNPTQQLQESFDDQMTVRNVPAQKEFVVCPIADFSRTARLNQFSETVKAVESTFPYDIPVVIGGETLKSEKTNTCYCPSKTDFLISTSQMANKEMAAKAVKIAADVFPKWRDTSLESRCNLLNKLADALVADRDRLSAIMSYEVGKTWKEADADLAEAVDFCRYYAFRAEKELAAFEVTQVLGESNTMHYEGRGVAVIIAPWNFPLAILCGMSVAALVAGNPIIMKPAEQSPIIAYELFKLMQAVGFPKDVIHFLPGDGEEIGPDLVQNIDVAQIAFTGSKAVGLSIIQNAAKTFAGQREVRRVVCEMGGKNAIIVDDDADLDEAVKGVLASAFSFAGQKCSACSRVIVVGSAREVFQKRLIEGARSMAQGAAFDPTYSFGPVIDDDSFHRLQHVIENPGAGAEKLFIGNKIDGGRFIPISIFKVSDIEHNLMQNEFFGPVLALYEVETFEEAIRVANQTPYALTGGVFSRSPVHLEQAKSDFKVGNLYLNRTCTGALVGRQPFGGFAMSGGGSKAGGPNYLLNFANPRVVTENTMRCGFTPDLES